MNMKKKIFISYSRADAPIVKPLVEKIEASTGVECWIDWNGIESGDQFEDNIVGAIDDCEIVLFMHSDNAIKSEWAKKEVRYASGEGKKVIPLLIDGNSLKGWYKFNYGGSDYIDINQQEHFNKLITNLNEWTKDSIDNNDIKILNNKAEEYEKLGDMCYNNELYDEAYSYYIKALECGSTSPFLYSQLAFCYYFPCGTAQDYNKAFKYFCIAEKMGYKDSYVWLARCYLRGHGVESNADKAIEFYEKGVAEGDTWCMYDLAEIVKPSNYIRFTDLLCNSAKSGNIDSLDKLISHFEEDVDTCWSTDDKTSLLQNIYFYTDFEHIKDRIIEYSNKSKWFSFQS